MVKAAAATIAAHQAELDALDSLVGDGDHGVNFATALARAAAAQPDKAAPGARFDAVAQTLAAEMGGASGVIFGALFGGMGRALHAADLLTAAGYVAALQVALEEVQRWGKAVPGDKTLVDALAPAAVAAQASAVSGAGLPTAAQRAAVAARAGAEATAGMEARKGRARFLGARAVGHADAGATSLALILEAWALLLADVPGAPAPAGK
jgi:dihydroxyacetone kinase-like protein